jgi:hypothetical protein
MAGSNETRIDAEMNDWGIIVLIAALAIMMIVRGKKGGG